MSTRPPAARHSSALSSTNNPSSNAAASANKTRQLAHLNAQLAQLNAHLADTQNLMRVTALQAQNMRFLGGYVGALFMGSAKVLGEESIKGKEREREGAGVAGVVGGGGEERDS